MIVVTGGAGFIGSNIVHQLEQRGAGPVVVCDQFGAGDKWRNLGKRDLADLIAPDALFAFLDADPGAIEAIIHMGAISSTTETNTDLILKNNFRLSLDLWRWCTGHGVRLIYASSAATYGDGGQGFDDDADRDALSRLRPLNPYGWSKHLFDRCLARALAAGERRPPQSAGLKFFNVYGPNEYHKGPQMSVVRHVHAAIKRGEPARLFKSHHPDYQDGGQLRDFIWVDDAVAMVMWLLDKPDVSGIFNCGTGQARSFKDLAAAVFAALGQDPWIEYVATPQAIRDKYQYFTEARMQRAADAGYGGAPTSLENGVKRYVVDFLEQEDPYR